MRKKFVKQLLFYFALTFILCTCNDPVFWVISQEVKPIEPRIKGVPTNFTVFDGRMYVASGDTLYTYNKGTEKAFWSTEKSPEGNIYKIESTGDYLYALCSTDQNNDGKTVIKRFDKTRSSWTQMNGILNDLEKINNIFSAGNLLFVTAAVSSTYYSIYYTILYIDNNGTINQLKTINPALQNDTGEITGAAYNGTSYFLPTKHNGVYKIDSINAGAYLIESNAAFSGTINLEDYNNTILLIARNGEVYTVNDSIIKIENVSMGKMATGILAIWKNPEQENERLLLAGRQDSLSYSYSYGYTYGYMELELDTNGIKSGSDFVEPGLKAPSTVIQNERYQSTIGKHPVNHLFQVPAEIDSEMILFASTQKSGVWSCRDRDNNYNKYWNAEE